MIELYTWMTDNGYKARQAMEESGLPYTLKPVNLTKKEQFAPDYLKLSPGTNPRAHRTEGRADARSAVRVGRHPVYLEKAGNGCIRPIGRAHCVDQLLFFGRRPSPRSRSILPFLRAAEGGHPVPPRSRHAC